MSNPNEQQSAYGDEDPITEPSSQSVFANEESCHNIRVDWAPETAGSRGVERIWIYEVPCRHCRSWHVTSDLALQVCNRCTELLKDGDFVRDEYFFYLDRFWRGREKKRGASSIPYPLRPKYYDLKVAVEREGGYGQVKTWATISQDLELPKAQECYSKWLLEYETQPANNCTFSRTDRVAQSDVLTITASTQNLLLAHDNSFSSSNLPLEEDQNERTIEGPTIPPFWTASQSIGATTRRQSGSIFSRHDRRAPASRNRLAENSPGAATIPITTRNLKTEVSRLNKESAKKDDMIRELEAEKSKMHKRILDLELGIEFHQTLSSGLEMTKTDLRALEAEYENLKLDSASVESDLEAAQQLATSLDKELEDVRVLLQNAEKTVEILRAENTNLKLSNSIRRSQLSALEARGKDLESGAVSFKKQTADLGKEIRILKEKIAQETESRLRAEDQMRLAQRDLRKSEAEKIQLTSSGDKSSKELADVRGRLHELTKEREHLRQLLAGGSYRGDASVRRTRERVEAVIEGRDRAEDEPSNSQDEGLSENHVPSTGETLDSELRTLSASKRIEHVHVAPPNSLRISIYTCLYLGCGKQFFCLDARQKCTHKGETPYPGCDKEFSSSALSSSQGKHGHIERHFRRKTSTLPFCTNNVCSDVASHYGSTSSDSEERYSSNDTLTRKGGTVDRSTSIFDVAERHALPKRKRELREEGRPRKAPKTTPVTTKNESIRAIRAARFNSIRESAIDPLEYQKKKVDVGKSNIHGLGLFAGDFIQKRHMIIEYTREAISHEEDQMREMRDKEEGRVLTYRFKLDERTVIDATACEGNESRYINHSCRPNSGARTIHLNGRRRLIFYALRGIGAGEEITYDYKFVPETDSSNRIECQCGEESCKGFLN